MTALKGNFYSGVVDMANDRAINIYNYTTGIVLLLILVGMSIIDSVHISDLLLFFVLIGANIIIDRFGIRIGRLIITFVPIIELASVINLGIIAAAWIQVIFMFITDYLINRKLLRTVIFNIGMSISKIIIAGSAFNFTKGLLGVNGDSYLSLRMLVPAGVFALLGFVINYVLVYVHFSLIDRKLFSQSFWDSIKWEFLSVLISIPVALEFTEIYKFSQGNNLLFAVLFLLPIIFFCFIFSLIKKIMFANTQLKSLSKVALTINSFLDLE
jgi:hypothetical protein